MRVAIIIFIILLALGVAAYCYWTGSPYFAFQEAVLAAQKHDRARFDKYVDATGIVDHALDDLLVQPALTTPGLSTFQSTVAGGALTMAKSSVTRGMLESLDKYFASGAGEQNSPTSYCNNYGPDAAIAAPTRLAQAGGEDGLKALLHAAGNEMSGEVSKLKSVAFNRMLVYIQNHPNTVPGRLLNCPPAERGAHVRQMLEEYGLTKKNFKGLAGCATTSDMLGKETAKVGFDFFSPKISKQIVVEVQLDKDLATGTWRIDQLSNIKSVMDQEEVYYDRDIHELVEYSLSGMSNRNMATDMRGMTERIKKNPAAQNILNRLNFFR